MKVNRMGRLAVAATALVCMALLALLVTSCGDGSTQATQSGGDGSKLPPGTTEEMLTQTTGNGSLSLESEGEGEGQPAEEKKEKTAPTASSPGVSGDLVGARFTVVAATRPDSNASVATSGVREVPGDYLEIELSVENIGDDLVDLSQYSFRLWSPGIDASLYEDYYGANGTFGGYVSENMISAVLLDYATLQPAAYKIKMGESVDGVFLFYDLNPKSAARNGAVTKEGTSLVIHKDRGDDAGEEVELNLAGYAD